MEKRHIQKVLKKVIHALSTKNYVKIKSLSNKVIHSASIDQDPEVISVAVIIYSLSKLIERESYKSYKNWESFYDSYVRGIRGMIKALEQDNTDRFRAEIQKITQLIESLSGNLKIYINHVFRRAKINKASRIYEHGISMEKTAKMLGISIWELAEYAGNTRIGDVNLSVTLPAKKRVKIAEEVFS
jgi:hypothetical protein